MDEAVQSTSQSKSAKTFSCVRCFERKVKCNRENPCSGCLRSKVEWHVGHSSDGGSRI
jgi:hypothetical protein